MNEVKRIPLPSEVWRHLKTMNRYVIVGHARDEATGDTLILYRSIEGDDPTIWARPINVFLWRQGQGEEVSRLVPRFGPVELYPVGK